MPSGLVPSSKTTVITEDLRVHRQVPVREEGLGLPKDERVFVGIDPADI